MSTWRIAPANIYPISLFGLVNNAQPLLRFLKAVYSGNNFLLLFVYILLHIGNLSFQMPYPDDLIVTL